jgi:hypothetical protein
VMPPSRCHPRERFAVLEVPGEVTEQVV